ncbi:LamG domain-containing protein [Pseudoalteromonas sp. C2R02]|uniref:LamG domain-containing protein n=1 Tax=Pseudoalteromonas sp. C2R02 TaxID=2841565 RepID=UPI001C08AEFE|nr:LamG domain-containing protein [Pseudoalteromonas sp. C2R02]MBU2969490.1 LamG domain-containing protein [Pseudoalteromonas sp. C2R02]
MIKANNVVTAILLSAVLFILSIQKAYSAACLDVFPGASQDWGPELTLENFKNSSNALGDKSGGNLALVAGQYKDVVVDEGGIVQFTTLSSEYRMKKLEIKEGATVVFLPGDYWIKDLKLEKDTTLAITGSGTVRIYAKNKIDIKENSHINDAAGELILIGYKNIEAEKELNFTGAMYSKKDIKIKKDSLISGSVTGKDVSINNPSTVTYDASKVTTPNFLAMCDSLVTLIPISEYRFDAASWVNGAANQVVDSISGFNGIAYGSQPTAGKLCNAVDLSASGVSDYIDLSTQAINGMSDFSISFWLNSNNTSGQSIFSGANSSAYYELVMWFNSPTNFQPYLKNYSNGNFTTASIADNTWHHVVWTRSGTENCLYRDKVLQGCVSHSSASLNINKFILGQEQSSSGLDDRYDFEGLVDELLIFDGPLSSAQITTIYDNQNLGLGYDGSARVCGLVPVAEYRFDELDWNGSAGDVKDSSDNDLHLTSYNASTENTSPVISGTPGFCRYGEFNGTDSYVQLDTDDSLVSLASEMTVTAWVNADVLPSGSNLKSIISKDENYEFHLDSNGEVFWWWGGGNKQLRTSGANITVGSWYHLAIAYKDGEQRIYVNGVSLANDNEPGTLTLNNDKFQVGQDQGFGNRFFDGSIDEVRVFDRFLSQSDVASIMADTRDCGSVLDHYRIEHDGAGLTCEAETITIKACEDSSCTNLYGSSTTLDFKADGVTQSTPTFTGETTVSLSQTTVGTLTLSVDNETVTASNPLVCVNSSGGSGCDIEFADVGLRFTDSTGNGSVDFWDQISGRVILEPIYIQPIKKNPDTGACQSVYTNIKPIEFQLDCIDPGSCTSMNLTLDNHSGSNETIEKSGSGNFTSVDLDFGLNGIAEISNLKYADAGKIKLNVRAPLQGSSDYMVGNSNEFVFRPKSYTVTIKDDDHGTDDPSYADDATDPLFKKTGENFTVQIQALNAENNVTLNYDDDDTGISLVPNITSKVQAPVGGEDGSLTIETYKFVDGISKVGANSYFNVAWDQVGILQLDASLDPVNYLNWARTDDVGAKITGSENNIGRFVPDHFSLIPSVSDHVTQECTNFTYMDQDFMIQYTLEAQNSIGVRMLNYEYSATNKNNYARSQPVIFMENTENGNYQEAGSNAVGSFGARLSAVNSTPNWDQGEFKFNKDEVKNSKFNRLAVGNPDGAYLGVNIILKLVDPDSSPLKDLDENPEDGNACIESPNAGANCTGKKLNSNDLKFRYGRVTLENSYGSELEKIRVPMKIEYWDNLSNTFKLNKDDSCTTYALIDLTTSPTRDVTNIGSEFENGEYKIGEGLLLDPAGNIAPIGVEFLVPDFLKFDWNNDNTDDNPSSTIQFGRYRGNDRVIYWREQ